MAPHVAVTVALATTCWIFAACQSPAAQADARADARPTASIASTTPPQSVVAGDGGQCRSDAECGGGGSCVYEESSCTAAGHCRKGGPRLRNCNVAIAMCACRDRHTFYGPGGCAGQASEPWELYACKCATDADCGGGQRCVPVGGRPHNPEATRECRPPNDLR